MFAGAAPALDLPPGELVLVYIRAEQQQMPECLRMKTNTMRQILKPTYRTLTHAALTQEEKDWLCKEADEKHPARYDQCTTKKGLIRQYGLYKESFFRRALGISSRMLLVRLFAKPILFLLSQCCMCMPTYLNRGVTMKKGAPAFGSLPAERIQVGKFLTKKRNKIEEAGYNDLTTQLTALKKARKEEGNVFVSTNKLNQRVDVRTTDAYIKQA
jgi:hypothetical protein